MPAQQRCYQTQNLLVARDADRCRAEGQRFYATGNNLKYRLPQNQHGKLEKLTEPGQELQIDFTRKLHNKKLNGEAQILIAVDRFSKWPTAKICKTDETKVLNFLTNHFNLKGIPERIKSDKGGIYINRIQRVL